MANGYDAAVTGSDSTLAYLQRLLLWAAILGERLPGTRRPIRLLNYERGLRELPSRILQSNLARSLAMDELPGDLEVVTIAQLEHDERALALGEVRFFSFRPAAWRHDRVELSLVIGVMRREGGEWKTGEIGHVDAAFHEIEGRWVSLNQPHVYMRSVY
jgi:hypothetical protein